MLTSLFPKKRNPLAAEEPVSDYRSKTDQRKGRYL